MFFLFASNDQHNQYFLAQTVEAGGVPGACLVSVPFIISFRLFGITPTYRLTGIPGKSPIEMNIFVMMILSDHTKTAFTVTFAVFMVNIMLEGHLIYL